MNEITNIDTREIDLYNKIVALIEEARSKVSKVVDITEVYTKFFIGKYIVEEEQHGKSRASYGKSLLAHLSQKLSKRFGEGWSEQTLRSVRQFYITYRDREVLLDFRVVNNLVNSVQRIQNTNSLTTVQRIGKSTTESPDKAFSLSWSYYLVLMRIKNSDERSFYEIECGKQNWSVRQLKRQYGSSLYERLALSRDKDEVMRLSKEGQIMEKPSDIIKNPITLEFLGLKPDAAYSESTIERAILTRMQTFLLEMGKGFLFEARQKRFVFDERNFYVDLVLYNRMLQCYVLIDLKNDDLTHQDLGQMQMYVNYYDRYVKCDYERPTIGILLCREKSDALVELTLPKDANIYASQYQLYLPDKGLLQTKLREWIAEFEENNITGGE